jgi:hypothetical protein
VYRKCPKLGGDKLVNAPRDYWAPLTELKTHLGYAHIVLDNFLAMLKLGNAEIILTTSWEHFPCCFEMFLLTTPR